MGAKKTKMTNRSGTLEQVTMATNAPAKKKLPARASRSLVNYKIESESEAEAESDDDAEVDDVVKYTNAIVPGEADESIQSLEAVESADNIVPGEADESVQSVQAAGAVEGVQVDKKPIFTVFRSENKLDEGICVIRSLGDGNYELVNLSNAHDMAAEETGDIIKATPGRRDMLAIPSELWKDVQAKADMAVKSAGELCVNSTIRPLFQIS
jgi:hypothetical protein